MKVEEMDDQQPPASDPQLPSDDSVSDSEAFETLAASMTVGLGNFGIMKSPAPGSVEAPSPDKAADVSSDPVLDVRDDAVLDLRSDPAPDPMSDHDQANDQQDADQDGHAQQDTALQDTAPQDADQSGDDIVLEPLGWSTPREKMQRWSVFGRGSDGWDYLDVAPTDDGIDEVAAADEPFVELNDSGEPTDVEGQGAGLGWFSSTSADFEVPSVFNTDELEAFRIEASEDEVLDSGSPNLGIAVVEDQDDDSFDLGTYNETPPLLPALVILKDDEVDPPSGDAAEVSVPDSQSQEQFQEPFEDEAEGTIVLGALDADAFVAGVAAELEEGPRGPNHKVFDSTVFDQEAVRNQLEHSTDVDAGEGELESESTDDPFDVPRTTRDLDELERIYEQYVGPVIAVVASLIRDRAAVDRTVEETFETAWRASSSFESIGPRGPWLFTLARRAATEQIATTEPRLEDPAPELYPAPAHRGDTVPGLDQSWQAWEVRLAVDRLTETERNVLRLAYYQGLIHPEIASELGITLGAVKSRAYSGSRRIIELLDHVIRPNAEAPPSDEQASSFTWYLAGLADGSELEERQRSVIKKIQTQLTTTPAWIQPSHRSRERLLELAESGPIEPSGRRRRRVRREKGQPGSMGRTTVQYDTEGQATATSKRVKAPGDATQVRNVSKKRMLAFGVCGVVAASAFGVRAWNESRSQSPEMRRYELQATDIDRDATAIVHVVPTDSGSRYSLELGGLDATEGTDYYAVWLVSTEASQNLETGIGEALPLGSFTWGLTGDAIDLLGGSTGDGFDVLVVTKQAVDNDPGPTGPVVLQGSVNP